MTATIKQALDANQVSNLLATDALPLMRSPYGSGDDGGIFADDLASSIFALMSSVAFEAGDHTKLDGIESGATADQTGAEIKTAYEGEADTNAFTDADHSKLDGIEAAADVTDDANVRAALAAATADIAVNSQKITGLAAPTAGSDAATKDYADALANGLDWKDSCRVATTGNIALTGEQTIDGVLTSADRVLVKDQTTASENGIYVSAAGAWSRAADADSDAEVTAGMSVLVEEGTANADRKFVLTTNDPITVGVTNLTFTVQSAGLADDEVTNAKLANMAQGLVKGRAAGAGTGDPVDLTAAQLRDIIMGDYEPNTEAGTAWTITEADKTNVNITTSDSAVTATAPLNASEAIPANSLFFGFHEGASTLTFEGEGAAVVNTPPGMTLQVSGRGGWWFLFKFATDEWFLGGDLIAEDARILEEIHIPISAHDVNVTIDTNVTSPWMPRHNITVIDVFANAKTAGAGAGNTTIDIHDDGTTIMATNKILIAAAQRDSKLGGVTQPTVSAANIDADSEVTFHVDGIPATNGHGGVVVTVQYKKRF